MSAQLSKSAQKVQDALTALGLSNRVEERSASTRTAEEAAQVVGCDVGQIVKSLLFRLQDSGEALFVLTSGRNRVCPEKLAALAGEPVGKADAAFVREKTGYAIGGVAPLGHPHKLTTLIDEDLVGYPELWAAAGTPAALFRLTPQELTVITEGRVACVRETS